MAECNWSLATTQNAESTTGSFLITNGQNLGFTSYTEFHLEVETDKVITLYQH